MLHTEKVLPFAVAVVAELAWKLGYYLAAKIDRFIPWAISTNVLSSNYLDGDQQVLSLNARGVTEG